MIRPTKSHRMTAPKILAMCAALIASNLHAQSTWDQAIDAFAARIGADVEADGVGSITAGVFIGSEAIWARGFGQADRDRGTLAGPRNIYRIGSISKSVTAVLMMLLVQDGVLDLDDPIATVLPEIEELLDGQPAYKPLTFRRLASHTGGLIREPELENAAAGPLAGWESKILASIPTTRFQAPPGVEYSYSNIGYGILGLALSRAAGRPFMELVEARIFRPLGMSSSTFEIGRSLRPRLATGYVNGRNGIDVSFPAREHAGRGYKVPNGGVYATVGDLGRFAAGVTGALELLDEETRVTMLTIQTPESETRGYGLGFSIRIDEDGTRWAGHGGSVAGYTAYLLFEPESGLGVVLMRNYNRGATNLGEASLELARELRAALALSDPADVGRSSWRRQPGWK